MREIAGTSNKIIEVNLTDQWVEIYSIKPRERKLYLGAKGLGLKLLFDRLEPGTDPLGPENIMAFMPGVLMGTGAPCSGRFEAVAKSPLTGIIGTASCGGPFGMALKTAGWDGMLIKGKAERPTYIHIDEEGVTFKDARSIWGMDIPAAQDILSARHTGSLVIGPAGENLVRFANIASGSRFLGRGGLGAVMGSKNLKAVVARGGAFKIRPHDPQALSRIKKKAVAHINRNQITGHHYRKFGTNANVRLNLKSNILPINNFTDGQHEKADRLSGEVMAQKHEFRHHNCKPCIIRCGHKGIFGDKEMTVPEYETIGLLGSSLGIFDSVQIAQWNQICNRLGMDTISAGSTLAWVMEAGEKGLVKSDLRFGSSQGVAQALEDIAYQKGFGKEMALGSRKLSEKYGGRNFAMQVKGLEMAAYDPRGCFGQGLAYAVANRGGCHLSAYMVAQENFFGLLKPDTIRSKAEWVKFFEDLTCCINALQTCQFTMYAYMLESPLTRFTPDPLLRLLMQYLPCIAIPLVDYSVYNGLWNAVTGTNISRHGFIKAGERIHVLERYMNCREGICRKDDTLPERLLKEGRASDPHKKTVPLDKMLLRYYKLRGYDSDGIPTHDTLKRLEII
jgi:aldehyde:ferredoxin oxidoreductase